MADEYTPGEIQRLLEKLEKGLAELTKQVSTRHHDLANQVASLPILTHRMDNAESKIKCLEADSKSSRALAQYVMGFAAALWSAMQFVDMFKRWTH